MANPVTHSDHTRSSPGPGVELRWPAAALWRTGEPEVRKITTTDVWEALAQGYDDFRAIPTHAFFICLIYPVAGLILFRLSFGYEILPLLYLMIAGFALLGPFVAIGLYELSRRREQGLDITPMRAFEVVGRPSFGAICRLGIVLAAIFVAWLYAANLIYVQIFGQRRAAAVRVLPPGADNPKGTQLIIVGNVVGFVFADSCSLSASCRSRCWLTATLAHQQPSEHPYAPRSRTLSRSRYGG